MPALTCRSTAQSGLVLVHLRPLGITERSRHGHFRSASPESGLIRDIRARRNAASDQGGDTENKWLSYRFGRLENACDFKGSPRAKGDGFSVWPPAGLDRRRFRADHRENAICRNVD